MKKAALLNAAKIGLGILGGLFVGNTINAVNEHESNTIVKILNLAGGVIVAWTVDHMYNMTIDPLIKEAVEEELATNACKNLE